jgi:SOS-response transcriptional repressor LexA
MQPTIESGDVLLIDRTIRFRDYRDLKQGDIVAALSPEGKPVVKRIAGLVGNFLFQSV